MDYYLYAILIFGAAFILIILCSCTKKKVNKKNSAENPSNYQQCEIYNNITYESEDSLYSVEPRIFTISQENDAPPSYNSLFPSV